MLREEPVVMPKPKLKAAKPFEISKQVVWEAYEKVKANKGAAGVDGESIEEFEEDLKGNLYKLWNRMSSGTYFPPPVRAVEIPKKGKGVRTLGVPTVADRIAQTVVRSYLEPDVEPMFHPDSYGYRPGRSALDAVATCRKRCWKRDWEVGRASGRGLEFRRVLFRSYLEPDVEPMFHPDSYGYRPGRSALDAVATCRKRCWKRDWVIDLDIRSFFDSIPHSLMLKAVSRHTDLRWVVLCIERWLVAPLQREDGTLVQRDRGTPQGSAISPLLA